MRLGAEGMGHASFNKLSFPATRDCTAVLRLVDTLYKQTTVYTYTVETAQSGDG